MKRRAVNIDHKILQEFKNRIKNLYGEKLKDIILYGSFARDESTEDSDIDLAVILNGEIKQGLEIDRMNDIAYEIGLENDVLISIYPISESKYKTEKTPTLINIRKEGIAV